MASIKGRYEWDDDDLTPGKKKEGGLHQNLFDGEGNLKGSARFVPDDGSDEPDRVGIYEPVYVDDDEDERRGAREQEDNAELAGRIVRELLILAAPHAKRLWIEKALPAIQERRAKRVERKAARRALKAAAKDPVLVKATVVEPSQEVAAAADENRTEMSSAEAQARYIAAMAAKAFSDEQMTLVANANIVDGEGLAELDHALAELPPEQAARIIEAVKMDPSIFSGQTLVDLGKILGVERHDAVAIEKPETPDSPD